MPGEKPEELVETDMFSGERHLVGGKKQREPSSELDDWDPKSPEPPEPAKSAAGGGQTTEAAIRSREADKRDDDKEDTVRKARGMRPAEEIFPED